MPLDTDLINCQAAPLGADDFSNAEHQALLIAVQGFAGPADDFGAADRLHDLPEVLQSRARAIFGEAAARPPLTEEKLLKDLGDSVLRLRLLHLSAQVRQLEALQRESQEAGTEEWRQYKDTISICNAQADHMQKLLHGRTMTGALVKLHAARKV